jgi:PhnB protein
MSNVTPIPPHARTVTPYLKIRGVRAALDFYKKAFGATERFVMQTPDGKSIMHAEVAIGDSAVMMTDENPQWGCLSPLTVGQTTAGVHLYVTDVDATFSAAVAAGAKANMPPTNMFWGDRFAKVTDPFGHEWSIATHVEDVPHADMDRRAREAFAQMAQHPPKQK